MIGEPGLDIAEAQAYLDGNEEARRALAIPKGAACAVRFMVRGEYNANFAFDHPVTGERLMLRISLGSQMHLADQVGYEARALELLKASGRTPEVLFVDSVATFCGHAVLVERWLEGRPLDYETDLEEAARILADVHAVELLPDHGLVEPVDPVGAIVEECVALFAAYRRWAGAVPRVVARIERLFAAAARGAVGRAPVGSRRVVNTELNSRNFLINDGAPGYLVDWEKPVAGEAAQDLAHFLAPTTTFWKSDALLGADEARGFVERYEAAVDGRFDTDGLGERVEDYLAATCLRGVTWCAMALARHEGGERAVADDATLAKVRAYVGDAFLDRVEERCGS